MSVMARIGWTIWALVPVALIAFHFGPGQRLAARDEAVRFHARAIDFENRAAEVQAKAYDVHLEVIELRRRDFLGDDVQPELNRTIEKERLAYEEAASAWEEAADAFTIVEDTLIDEEGLASDQIRWSKARALVRSGDIWGGAGELEVLLGEVSESPIQNYELVRATREELARAHYFGARLMRLSGEPAKDWRAEATKARQHFRYLAEQSAASGDTPETVRGLEDNVERVLDLEQQDLSDIEGTPLPRQSPRMAQGNRPGRNGEPRRTRRPPQGRDGRGASGAGEIGRGW